MNGKGDSPRKRQVNYKTYADNWELAFKKEKDKKSQTDKKPNVPAENKRD